MEHSESDSSMASLHSLSFPTHILLEHDVKELFGKLLADYLKGKA
jgi:hypothetical protein